MFLWLPKSDIHCEKLIRDYLNSGRPGLQHFAKLLYLTDTLTSMPQTCHFCYGCLGTLKRHLHSLGVQHQNISPENGSVHAI